MLTKIYNTTPTKSLQNITPQLYNFLTFAHKNNIKYQIAQDTGKYVLIKNNEEYYVYKDCSKDKFMKLDVCGNKMRVIIQFNGKYFWKSIDTFNQNNKLIANNIRRTATSFLHIQSSQMQQIKRTLVGIGGEYYVYFCSSKYDKYIGYTNYINRYEDAVLNCRMYGINVNNVFTDFGNFSIDKCYVDGNVDVIINVLTLKENIIREVCKLNVEKLVIITCKPLWKKVDMLKKYFVFQNIEYFVDTNCVSVSLWKGRGRRRDDVI